MEICDLVVKVVEERDGHARQVWDGCLCWHFGIDLSAEGEVEQDADLVAEGNSTAAGCTRHKDTDPSLGTPWLRALLQASTYPSRV